MANRKTSRHASSIVREDEALRLRGLQSVAGYAVIAKDGEVGAVEEFLFDDREWAIRFIVVRTGDWLPGKKVLLPPSVLEEPDWELPKLHITIERAQLARGPILGAHEPASRMFQIDLYKHFGWAPFWLEEEYFNVPLHPSEVSSGLSRDQEKADDPHLLSTADTIEYRVEALNGDVGHPEDFVMDEDDWIIYYFAVALDRSENVPEEETAKSVLIATEWVQKTAKEAGRVYLELDRDAVLRSPAYDPALPVDREYELELYDHYGRPRYWDQGADTEEEEDTRFSS
ncbi:MAG TPA: PRC-barrel domain-containing protein [Dissulfurispiraceae bacterium]